MVSGLAGGVRGVLGVQISSQIDLPSVSATINSDGLAPARLMACWASFTLCNVSPQPDVPQLSITINFTDHR